MPCGGTFLVNLLLPHHPQQSYSRVSSSIYANSRINCCSMNKFVIHRLLFLFYDKVPRRTDSAEEDTDPELVPHSAQEPIITLFAIELIQKPSIFGSHFTVIYYIHRSRRTLHLSTDRTKCPLSPNRLYREEYLLFN